MQLTVGGLRPDFVARCQPDLSANNSNEILCRGKPSLVDEGRRSFPSGHASSNFSLYIFTSSCNINNF